MSMNITFNDWWRFKDKTIFVSTHRMSLFPAYSNGDSVQRKCNEQGSQINDAGLLSFIAFYATF
jgi:hypothetical protein